MAGAWERPRSSKEWAGRVTGVLGLSALLVTAAMCVRLPGLDRWFGGLPRLWLLHRRLGFSAFMLILAHVLLLAFAATLYPSWHASRVNPAEALRYE